MPDPLDALKDHVDLATFVQILEMDEMDAEDEEEFSYGIVRDFFIQAEDTFTKMDERLEEEDLAELSSLGHFLKGSSATLGINKVRDSCEKIQQYGKLLDPNDNTPLEEKECLEQIREVISQVRTEYAEAKKLLQTYYQTERGVKVSS